MEARCEKIENLNGLNYKKRIEFFKNKVFVISSMVDLILKHSNLKWHLMKASF